MAGKPHKQHSGQPQNTPWTRLAGMGFEFAASLAVFMLLGYWVDYHWQIPEHRGALIGLLLGLIGGTYNFIREARLALRQSYGPGSKPPAGTTPDDSRRGPRKVSGEAGSDKLDRQSGEQNKNEP